MTSIAVDVLAVILAVVCLYRAEPAAPFSHGIHEDYLSAENGKYVRGLLSMVVVFHHLARPIGGAVLFPLFGKLGYLAVAVFFFLSGYGLMKQYIHRENYKNQFLLRRLPAVLIPYLIATVLYWFLYRILGEPWSVRAVFAGILTGSPIVVASWYIICILLFYIAFRILMGLCGKHHNRMIPGGLIYCGLYVLFCVKMGYGAWWYNTAPVLIFGMVWALYEQRIGRFFREKYWIAAPGLVLLFAIVYGVKIYLNGKIHCAPASVFLTWCVAILFVCCVLLALMKLKLRSPVLRWLGEISLETYLCHYLFILLLRSERFMVENDFLCAVLVMLCTLSFAYVFHLVNRRILGAYARVLDTYSRRLKHLSL